MAKPRQGAPPSASRAAALPSASPDVQAAAAPHLIALTRVGVRGVRKPVTVHRPSHGPAGVVGAFDLFVDLPAHQKGTHMSRNLEALADVLDEEVVGRETSALENLCQRLADRLLSRHDYATHAQASVAADYFMTRTNPGGKPTVEAYRIQACADAFRAGPPMRRIGVEVVGMSACPCAMETVRHKLAQQGRELPADLPYITHNQRNRAILSLDLPPGEDVEAGDLVDICEASLSAPTFEYLKRGDEGDLVLRAHNNPRFVEDVVRELLARTEKAYGKRLRGSQVFASSEAEESIHKHNAYAERRAVLGEL